MQYFIRETDLKYYISFDIKLIFFYKKLKILN